jgi:hypothetical protein
MITGKSIPEIMRVAVDKYKLRATNGPYFFDQERLQVLLATFGYVAGNYCWRRLNTDHLCRLNIDQGLALSF